MNQMTHLIDIWIAIGIFLLFRIFSSPLSYIIIRMFKFKEKKISKIKESAFYQPLRVFFVVLGIYLAIVFLKEPFSISDKVMQIATKVFKIVSILTFAKGFAKSFTIESTFVKKMQSKMNQKVEDSMFQFGLKIVRVIIYLVAGFLIITELGFNLNGLVAGLGIGGIIITLAAQDTAQNLFAGLVIFLDKPFMVGDWIEMDPFEGTIEDITFRSTRLRTFENALVNIPNSIIANSSIINWSKMEKRRYKMNLCIEMDTPLEKLEKFKTRVQEMLASREAIYDNSIVVKFDTISENGLNVLICSFTDSVDYTSFIAEKEEINMKIMNILKEEEIQLSYDTKTVYVKN